jgi:2-dehydropantoate 2-reductase
MPERILVWGAGAIGGTVGAFLARAGHDVTFVDIEPAHVAAIADPARGLSITGPVEALRVSAPAFVPEAVVGVWDQVFLCVKAQHTEAASRALLPHLGPDGFVLSLQNGLCEGIIAGVAGEARVIGAFINFGADWMGPGEVLYGNRGAFVLGELDGRITPRLRALHETIRTGFEPGAVMVPDIQSYLWGKLGYAALLFAQALGQKGIADCLARPELLPLWRALGGEVHAVAAATGVGQRGFNGFEPAAFAPDASLARARGSVDAMVAFNRPNAKTHSGIWRDLAVRKRRTEVDLQVLPVVEAGAAHGVDTPKCRKLVAMIHEIEDGRRPMTDDNLLELLRA